MLWNKGWRPCLLYLHNSLVRLFKLRDSEWAKVTQWVEWGLNLHPPDMTFCHSTDQIHNFQTVFFTPSFTPIHTSPLKHVSHFGVVSVKGNIWVSWWINALVHFYANLTSLWQPTKEWERAMSFSKTVWYLFADITDTSSVGSSPVETAALIPQSSEDLPVTYRCKCDNFQIEHEYSWNWDLWKHSAKSLLYAPLSLASYVHGTLFPINDMRT